MTAVARCSPTSVRAGAGIVGVGARAACGLTALQVAMAVRAGKLAPRGTHLVDREGESIAMVRLPSIGDDVSGFERFVRLGTAPLVQATATSRERAAGVPLPLVLALPPRSRPGFDPRLERHVVAGLEAASGIRLDGERSRLVLGGSGGGATAFAEACAILQGGASSVVVGGIDSWFDPDALEALDVARRLHGPTTENGFIPGEGAAFLLLSRTGPRVATLASVGVALEPHPFGSDEPNVGAGATAAVRAAVQGADAEATRCDWALTDVVNERHRVDEWTYASARNHRALTVEAEHDQPMLELGDVGAASAPMLAVLATVRWQTGCAAGRRALIAVASDGPERGALVLDAGAA